MFPNVWILFPALTRVAPKYLKLDASSSGLLSMVMLALMLLVHHYFGFHSVELYLICANYFNEFVGQVLEVTAHNMVNIICKTQVADRSTTDRNRSVVVVESLLHNSF